MAKAKTSKKKPAKKKPAKKTAAKRKKISVTEGPLPPKERAKALRKLRKLSIRPSHPSAITGPAIALNYDAPLPKKSKPKKHASRRIKKKG